MYIVFLYANYQSARVVKSCPPWAWFPPVIWLKIWTTKKILNCNIIYYNIIHYIVCIIFYLTPAIFSTQLLSINNMVCQIYFCCKLSPLPIVSKQTGPTILPLKFKPFIPYTWNSQEVIFHPCMVFHVNFTRIP